LQDEQIGVATGYRWFIQKQGGFATHFRSVWNASIASALGANTKSNFCWGGSMAMRREMFERLQIREKWSGTLSDDFAVTRAMKEAGLLVYFVPQCLTASVEDCTFGEMLEFTTRQMKITRVYAGHFWLTSLLGSLIFTLTFYSLLLLIVWRIVSGESFWLPFLLLLVIFALGAGKAWLRLKAVKLILKDYGRELKESSRAQILLFPLTPTVFLYNSICAAVSRKIAWRGIVYEMKSPTETIIISTMNPPNKPAKVE
jgi:cellulose synthase/poly-beta-1,6-N-acetylglucosamine synthase-like glycosyltransferase